MEQSTQLHAGNNGGATAQVHSVTIEDPRRMHPDSTNRLPHPGYTGEPDGRPVEPDASWDNDATGPVAVEPATPYADEQIDGPFDIDWFSVDLVAGRSYVIHIRAQATGDATLDDPACGGFWLDPDSDGLELQEMSGYRQTDGEQGTNTVLTMTAAQSGTYYFAAFARNWALRSATGGYSVEVYDRTDDAAAGERTDSVLDLQEFAGGTRHATGTDGIETDGDRDWFRFDVQDGREGMVFQLFLQGVGGFDPKLAVHRLVESEDGTRAAVEIAADDNGGYGCLPRLVFIPEEAGTYFVEVRSSGADGLTAGVGAYELHIVDTGAPGGLVGTDSTDDLKGDELPNPMFGLEGDDDMAGGAGDDELRAALPTTGWPAAAAGTNCEAAKYWAG